MTTPEPPPRFSAFACQSVWAIGALLLIAAVFLVYGPVLGGGFLWDDGFLVQTNALIRSPVLILENFQHYLFSEAASRFYRPVQNISYIFDYWRGGLAAPIYHQTNLLIHALGAVLLFLLAGRWLKTLGGEHFARPFWPALTLALLWAVHPAHSAVCAYVSGRADSLALLFFLSGWWFWEKAGDCLHEKTNARTHPALILWSALALLCGLLAMCSKEIAAEALLLFLLQLWVTRRELDRKWRLQSSFGAFLLFGLYFVLRHLPQDTMSAQQPPSFTALERIGMFFRAMGDYFRLLIFPNRLYMERQIIDQPALLRHPVNFDAWFPWLGWLGGILLLLLTAGLLWRGEGRKLRIFGVLWFMVMILPVSNLFSLNASVAEHWLYFPSIGFLLFLAGCAVDLRLGAQARKIAAVLLVLAILALGTRAWFRAADWHDALTFYQATIHAGGDSVRIRINLAAEYKKLGQLDEAAQMYRRVLQKMPTYAWVQNLLVENLRAQGRTEEADAMLQHLSRQPPSGDLKERTTYLSQLIVTNQLDPALAIVRAEYEQHPQSWQLAGLFCQILVKQNHPDAAIAVVGGFAERNWWHYDSHESLGELLAKNGRTADAIQAWEQAAVLDLRDVRALNLIAAVQGDAGQWDQAIQAQQKAVRRQPSAAEWNLLADLYRDSHRPGDESAARAQAAAVAR